MATLFMDGCSHYTTAEITQKWSSNSSGVVGSGTGRFGTNSLRFSGVGAASISKSLVNGDATSVMGWGFRTNFIGNGFGAIFVQWGSMEWVINSAGTLTLRRSGVALASSTNAMSNNVYYHVGIKVFHSATVGTVQLQVNGVDWIALTTGLNTGGTPGGLTLTNNVGNPYTTDYSDIYVLDGTGSAPWNDLLGDCKVETLRPTAEGAYAAWQPTPSGNQNNQNVDETTTNGDTDYNSSSAGGDRDTFVETDVASDGGQIFSVQSVVVARKTDTGVRTIAPSIHHAGVPYDGTAVALATSYAQYRQIYDRDPTGAAWTVPNVNADEFGYVLGT